MSDFLPTKESSCIVITALLDFNYKGFGDLVYGVTLLFISILYMLLYNVFILSSFIKDYVPSFRELPLPLWTFRGSFDL